MPLHGSSLGKQNDAVSFVALCSFKLDTSAAALSEMRLFLFTSLPIQLRVYHFWNVYYNPR